MPPLQKLSSGSINISAKHLTDIIHLGDDGNPTPTSRNQNRILMTAQPQSLHFRTDRISIFGSVRLQALCDQLIAWSQWFSITPLPHDEWEVEVKIENAERVRSWVQAIE